MDEVTALQSRLSRMEGRFRAMAVAWVAGAAVVLVLGIGAQRALSQSQVLNVRELNVVDQSGRTRISLGFGAQSGRPAIWLYDDKGKSRFYIGFGTQRGSPVLLLSDEAGTGRIYLGFSATGASTPQLTLSDERGTTRLYVGWSNSEKPTVFVHDASGADLWHAP